MVEPQIIQLYSLFIAVLMAIDRIIERIDLAGQRKLNKKLKEFISQFRSLINDADMIFNLIKNADEQINEYGEDKFTRIIQDNFKDQIIRLNDIVLIIYDSDMSLVFDKLEDKLKWELSSMFNRKCVSIIDVIERITHSKLKYKNGQLYIKNRLEKIPAFPNFDKQFEVLTELKEKHESLEKKFYTLADIRDV